MGLPNECRYVFERAFRIFGKENVLNALRYRYRRIRPAIERDAITTICTMLEDGNMNILTHADTHEYIVEMSLCLSNWISGEGINYSNDDLPICINSERNPCYALSEYYDILFDAYLRFGHNETLEALSTHYSDSNTFNGSYIHRVICQMRNPVFVPEISEPVQDMMNLLKTWIEHNELTPNTF
jgi:hypothetical protein